MNIENEFIFDIHIRKYSYNNPPTSAPITNGQYRCQQPLDRVPGPHTEAPALETANKICMERNRQDKFIQFMWGDKVPLQGGQHARSNRKAQGGCLAGRAGCGRARAARGGNGVEMTSLWGFTHKATH